MTAAATKQADLLIENATPAGKPPATTKRKPKSQAIAKVEPSAETPLLRVIMEAARDPSVDPAKMEALLKMARDEDMRMAERCYDEAMAQAQNEMPKVARESYNKHTKSWWAKIENVSAKCDPIIRRHGFTLSYGMSDSPINDHYRVLADVTWRGRVGNTKLSFTKRYNLDIGADAKGPKGEGTKSLAQGSVSSFTYARRNLKLGIFDVLVLGVDKDGNPEGVEPISKEQLKDLRAKMKAANIPDDTFCTVFQIEAVEQLPVAKLETALWRIAQKAEKAT